MKKLTLGLFMILFSSVIFAQLPPIIDREIFFGDPELAGAQISPDGKYITFLKPFNGVRNIWVKERNQKFEEARPLTADTKRPIGNYFWSYDSKYVLYVQDQGGNENFRIYAVDPSQKGDPVPHARDLTPLENVRAMIIDLPKQRPDEIMVGLNDRNPQLHDVYKLKISTGERTLIRKNEENIAGWMTDIDGNLRIGIRQTEDGGSEILKIKGEKLESIYKVTSEETANPVRFTPDGKSFYLISNKGDNIDKAELLLFDLNSGKTKLVEKDPMNEVDIASAVFSDKTNELIATVYVGAKRRVYPKTKEFENVYNTLKKLLPEGDVNLSSSTEDENLWIVSVSRDVDPGSTYLYDKKAGKVELLYKSRPTLPTEYLAPMEPFSYKARDGMTIHGYLTLPKGIEHKNLPVVMFVHGGPWARDFWGYNPYAQFLANRGYAVFQPNFRGSTGYGKKYLNAGNKQWGTGSMQHDITDAVKYLIGKGIADPKRVAISGGSYGGYATLAGLAFTPDLYACGFSIVGPSNIITLLNSIPPYWAPIRKTFAIRVGDMDKPDELEMLKKQSLLNSADKITAPLYVVQGANDPRVKKAESDQIVVALRDLKRDVEYMVAPDEGHGFAGLENRLAMVVAMERFLAKHLNGRVQEDVREAIQKKLNDITVDINTVTMPKKVETGTSSEYKSYDGSKIKLGNVNFLFTVETQGQKFNMNVGRTLTKELFNGKDVIRSVDITSGMMGGNDTLLVDAKTLLPVARNIKQGMGTVHLKFENGKVEGMLEAGPQKLPINVNVDVPIVSDGAGLEMMIESLALTENSTVKFYQLDLMDAKTKEYILKVVGSDKINVSAGDYETYKVDIKEVSGEGEPIHKWVDKNSGKTIKTVTKLGAQMGGGTVTIELTK
ncbi:MAG: prolyl oligopeptidase family serine peptidase [Melioribacter sp.]|nr:prolyl oligopeptidase family serine peptidase [Melioribacter sp.]